MMKRALFVCLAAGGLLLSAQTPPAAPGAKPAREDGLYATIQTSQGDIVVKMYEKEAPITVKNFMDLSLGRKSWKDPKTGQRVRRPLYPGLTFHRVIPNFMIQGGDPLGNSQGGTDVIPDEIVPSLKFDLPGRLAMANAGPKTGSCQFFITEVPTPNLNGQHTIFGQTVEGMGVVRTIARASTKATIKKIAFERVGPGPAVNPPAPVAAKKSVAPAKKAAAKK